MSKGLKVVIAVVLSFVLLTSGFIGGFATAAIRVPGFTQTAMDAAKNALGSLRSDETTTAAELSNRVGEVQTLLDGKALEPSNITSATAGAINGLLESTGDKWASYFPPVESDEFSDQMNGSFGGIGVVLTEDNGKVSISEVYPDTPAQAAGVLAGDVIVAIDGKKQDTWTTQEVSSLVRGEKGTDVSITFFRPSEPGSDAGEEYTKTITRGDIKVKNLMTEVHDGVGYMAMGSFNSNSTEEVGKAIEEFDKQGVSGYVLDLRYNGGGLLNQAIGIASLFLDEGDVVVKTEDRGGAVQTSTTTLKKITDKPLVVLVNGHSASASEVLVGALKDHDRAEIVGQKTFGKGSVQEVFELTFGGSIKFTTAHWLTPKDHMIDGQGIEPDVAVEDSTRDLPEGTDYNYTLDAQLMKSIQEVQRLAK